MGKSSEDCFDYLKVPRRWYLLQKPEKKESFRNEYLFGYLLDGIIEEEWKLTKITIDTPPDLHIDDKLDILQQLWDTTKSLKGPNEDQGFVAKSRWLNSRFQKRHQQEASTSQEDRSRNRDDLQSFKNRSRGYQCYVCKSEEHRADICIYKEPAYEWAYKLRLKDEKRGSTSSKNLFWRKDSPCATNDRRTKFNQPKTKRSAYVVQEIDGEISELPEHPSNTEGDNEEIQEEEMMAFAEEWYCGERQHPLPLPT